MTELEILQELGQIPHGELFKVELKDRTLVCRDYLYLGRRRTLEVFFRGLKEGVHFQIDEITKINLYSHSSVLSSPTSKTKEMPKRLGSFVR